MAAPANLRQAMDEAAAAFAAGRLEEAQALCERILRADPAHFFALHLGSVIAARRARWQDAADLATRALAVRPREREVLVNRGAALRMLQRYDEALADYDAALALAPEDPAARNNRGVALAALGRHEEALAEFGRALAAAPGSAEAHFNRGTSLAALNRHREAVESHARALSLQPGHARARFNRALSRLALGDFGGFEDYEARAQLEDRRAATRVPPGPRWDGAAPVEGRTVLLMAEQGLGDTLQFSRFARVLHARGARVVLEAPAALVPVLAPLPYLDAVVAADAPLPPFDLWCPLPSLPALLRITPETLPPQDPALAAPPEALDHWSRILGERHAPRIGLAWSGGTGLAHDPRAIALEQWSGLRELPATLVSLQKEIREGDRPAVAALGLRHFGDAIRDFGDTAALASLMDVVVTIDTSVAHLAGAMHLSPWIVLPFAADWRWLLERETSPWYPGARLLRQPSPGDWAPVIARVQAELRARLAAKA